MISLETGKQKPLRNPFRWSKEVDIESLSHTFRAVSCQTRKKNHIIDWLECCVGFWMLDLLLEGNAFYLSDLREWRRDLHWYTNRWVTMQQDFHYCRLHSIKDETHTPFSFLAGRGNKKLYLLNWSLLSHSPCAPSSVRIIIIMHRPPLIWHRNRMLLTTSNKGYSTVHLEQTIRWK